MASRKEQLQKRKAREKRRQEFQLSRHRAGESPLAYAGNRYKRPDLLPVHLETETAIFEAFTITQRAFTDYDVQYALESLIGRLRRGDLPVVEDGDEIVVGKRSHTDFITERVLVRWQILFETNARPPRDDLIGVLRTILNSIGVWKTVSRQSRGYLSYLEGFLKKLGIRCELVDGNGQSLDGPPEHEIFSVARAWADGVGDDARIRFEALATELIAEGQGELVAEACQQAMGSIASGGATPIVKQLGTWSMRAQQPARRAIVHTPR
jgi:hypothetical protein